MNNLQTIQLSQLQAAPWRFTEDRSIGHQEIRDYTPAQLNIALSLQEHGQLSPIHVRLLPGTRELYEIVDGHVVVDAARQLGLESLDAVVHEGLFDEQARLLYIHFNLNRAGQYHVKIHRVFGQVGDVATLQQHVAWPASRIRDYVELDERSENWKQFMFVSKEGDPDQSAFFAPAEQVTQDWE